MKKIVKLSLLLLLAMCIVGNIYAAVKCDADIQLPKTEFTKTEEFTVNVNIANIQSDRGVISFDATLEYDKDSLEIVRMEGKNGWETPTEAVTYNSSNGKIAITRSGLGKSNETIFTITFRVKEGSKPNATIALRNVTIADGTQPQKISLISKDITIKEATNPENPTPQPGGNGENGGANTGVDNPNGSTNTKPSGNTNNTNKKPVKIPQAGENSIYIIAGIGVLTISTVIFCIKFKMLNK